MLGAGKALSLAELKLTGFLSGSGCAADDEKPRAGRVAELFVYDNFSRVPVEQVEAGDICALTGLADVAIGETICAREAPNPLPTIKARLRVGYLVLRVRRRALRPLVYQTVCRVSICFRESLR